VCVCFFLVHFLLLSFQITHDLLDEIGTFGSCSLNLYSLAIGFLLSLLGSIVLFLGQLGSFAGECCCCFAREGWMDGCNSWALMRFSPQSFMSLEPSSPSLERVSSLAYV